MLLEVILRQVENTVIGEHDFNKGKLCLRNLVVFCNAGYSTTGDKEYFIAYQAIPPLLSAPKLCYCAWDPDLYPVLA